MVDIKVNVFLISRSLKTLQQSAYEPIRKDTGLTQMELQIIFSISQLPISATVGNIHKQTGFNKGQISVCLSNLLKNGYLEKIENKETQIDSFTLSEKGKELAKRIEKSTAHGRKKLFKGFTQEEVDKCKEYLGRMLENAKEELDGKNKQ